MLTDRKQIMNAWSRVSGNLSTEDWGKLKKVCPV